MALKFNGEALLADVKLAASVAVAELGDYVVHTANPMQHFLTGTERRSTHIANPNYDGSSDEEIAFGGEVMEGEFIAQRETLAEANGLKASILVGTWVPYGYEEEVERGHAALVPAVASLAGATAFEIVAKAFAEHGLTKLEMVA